MSPIKQITINPKKLKAITRAKKYAKKYIETGGNQTEAYKGINPTVTRKTAQVEGSKELLKPITQLEIRKLFEAEDLNLNNVLRIHKRNLNQSKQLGVSQSAVNDYYELTGVKRRDNEERTQIAIVINTSE